MDHCNQYIFDHIAKANILKHMTLVCLTTLFSWGV